MEIKIEERKEWKDLTNFSLNRKLPVYNWIWFREGFSREIVWKIMDMFDMRQTGSHHFGYNDPKGFQVLDPFCGSGTTLLACKERGIGSVGIDRLPIAILASRVKTRNYEKMQLREEAKKLFSREIEATSFVNPFERFFPKEASKELGFFRREIFKIEGEGVREFFLLALAASAFQASWIFKDGDVLKARKRETRPLRKLLRFRVERMRRELKTGEEARVMDRDPWDTGLDEGMIDGVITSPPYLKIVDYSKVYSVENWIIGRESRTGHYSDEGKYFQDMEKVLEELKRVCRPGAGIGIVIGTTYLPKEDRIVNSDLEFARIAERVGLKAERIIVLKKRFALRNRTEKRGELRESLVILRK